MNQIQKFSVVYFVILAIMFSIIFSFQTGEKVDFVDGWNEVKDEYSKNLIQIGQGIIALIIIISVLYLGKFHDFQKDMTKLEVELNEITWKFKKKFPNPTGAIDDEIYAVSKNSKSQFDRNQNILGTFTKFQISFLAGQIFLVAWALLIMSTEEQKNFVVSVLMILTSIFEFGVIWGVYESMLKIQRAIFRKTLFDISSLKRHLN